MFGGLLRAQRRNRRASRNGRARRRIGCLGWPLWLAAALVLLLVLGLLFGGWQKGTKAGLAEPHAAPAAQRHTVPAAQPHAVPAAYQP